MTENSKVNHRKNFISLTMTTAGGQCESLQGVTYYACVKGGIRKDWLFQLSHPDKIKALLTYLL